MLHERAQRLRSIGQALGLDAAHERNRKARVAYNKYKQAVYFLEQDWAKVRIAYKQRGGNPLRCVTSLISCRVSTFAHTRHGNTISCRLCFAVRLISFS